MTLAASEDVLLLIFKLAVESTSMDVDWPEAIYDAQAAKAPFTIAAVCCRWRSIALATSALWSYLGFPNNLFLDDPHIARASMLRERSGNSPVDIVVTGSLSEKPHKILEHIMATHGRWRRVVLDLDEIGNVNPHMLLSSHEPMLESLAIARACTIAKLPKAPRMRRLYLECTLSAPLVPLPALSGPHCLAGLTHLALYSTQTAQLLQALPDRVLAHLIDLTLVEDVGGQDFTADNVSQLLMFPNLNQLTVDDACWLAHIRAPKLTALVLRSHGLWEGSRHFANFANVTHLQFYSMFSTSSARKLQHLKQITTLTFSCPKPLYSALMGDYNVSYGALSRLAEVEPPLWPRLHTIQFLPFRSDEPEPDEPVVNAQDLIGFVRTRNSLAAEDSGTVARIERVVASYPHAPDWMKQELLELTAA